MKKEIKLMFDYKMRDDSFEAYCGNVFEHGESEKDVLEKILSTTDLSINDVKIVRTYNKKDAQDAINDHNLWYNPRFSWPMRDGFLDN